MRKTESRTEKRKHAMKEKEPDKENSHLHMTTDVGEYELM